MAVFCLIILSIFGDGITRAHLSDSLARTEPGLNSLLPEAGSIVADPLTGSKVIRVTDERDGQVPLVARARYSSFNPGSTRFLVDIDGVATLYSFDASALTFQKEGPLFDGQPFRLNEMRWSANDPDTLIGLSDSEAGGELYAYNVRAREFTPLKENPDLSAEGEAAKFETLRERSGSAQYGGLRTASATGDSLNYFSSLQPNDAQTPHCPSIVSTGRHVYLGIGPGTVQASGWVNLPGTAIYSKTHAVSDSGDYTYSPVGFVKWKGAELTEQASADLGPGQWYYNSATDELFARMPDDSNPNTNGDLYSAPVIGDLRARSNDVIRISKDGSGTLERLADARTGLWEDCSDLRINLSRDGRFIAFNSLSGPSRSDVFIAAINSATSMDSVVWTNTVNCTPLENTLQKTSGLDDEDDARATSMQSIQSGDGQLEFTIHDNTKERWCGLSNSNSIHQAATDIDFAIQFTKKKAFVYEKGEAKKKTKYKVGYVFRIAIESGVVKYYKNNQLFYTSTLQPVYPLLVTASLVNKSSQISNAMIAGAGFNPVVSISPADTEVGAGGVMQFAALVTGGATSALNWTASGGAISTEGIYTAPAATGSFTVMAASAANPVVNASSVVRITPKDTKPPEISNVVVSNVSATGVVVAWRTNEPSDTQVEFGTTTAYGSVSALNPAMVLNHSVAFGGLSPLTLYHFRVRSKDPSGNAGVSRDYTFTTAPGGDTQPPVISNVASGNLTSSGASVNWTTNEASDSQVEYGSTTSYGSSTPVNTSLVTSHSLALTGLSSGTTYHFRVKSRDAAGNQAVSADFTFATSSSGGGGGGGGSSVPMSYNALTDRSTRREPSLPNMGGATGRGTLITDPTFGSRIRRITDANTRPDRPNRSFFSPSSSEQNTWNTNSTLFFITGEGGEIVPYSFNPSTMVASRLGDTSNESGGLLLNLSNPEFSHSDPNLIYGTGGAAGRSIVQYNFQTDTYTTLLNLDTVVQGLSGSTGDLSEGVNQKLCTYFGGQSQDQHFYILVWDKTTGQQTLLNTVTSRVNGNPTNMSLGWHIHNARLEKGGRYVTISPSDGPNGQVIWDTQTGNIALAPSSGGHKVGAFGYMLNHDGAGDGAVWQRRSLNLSNLGAITQLISPLLTPSQYEIDSHLSWNNAQANALAPVLISTYRNDRGLAQRAWDNEIIAVRTDGTQTTVWRIAHHRSVPVDFGALPKGNVSQDGRWFMFSSNWGQSLGSGRVDAFVVELKADGSAPPPPPPPPPGDTTPPVISNVASGNLTSSGASVNWTTNEASDSQVEYGSTTSYGSSTPVNTSLVTSHSLALTGLSSGTTYHFRVKSRDAAGNQAVSADFTFATSSSGGGGGGGGSQAVVWTSIVNCTATGNSLRKSSGRDDSPDAGAVSQQVLVSGDGYMEFTATETNKERYIGLSKGNDDTTPEDIDFGIKLTDIGIAAVRENNVYKWDLSYATGDVFRIAVEGGVVKYYKNGTRFYTSQKAPSYPLLVDTSFVALNGSVGNVVLVPASNGVVAESFDKATESQVEKVWFALINDRSIEAIRRRLGLG